MSEADFGDFLARSITDFAEDKVRAGSWDPNEAVANSRQVHEKLVSHGLSTPNQHLYMIELDGHSVGNLWLALEQRSTEAAWFIYDVFVEQSFRRRGIGFEALTLLEKGASQTGIRTIGLHVFGYNAAARKLYEKLGYEVTDINRRKISDKQRNSQVCCLPMSWNRDVG